jgi:hypothetical protein
MTPPLETHLSLEDPRCCTGFLPHYHPRVNGGEAPPVDTMEGNERMTIEFLAAYYHLNCEYSKLLEIRQRPAGPVRSEAEMKALQALEKILIVRDSLEDRYAPLGVITDPVVKDGFTVDLNIRFGNADAAGRRRTDAYTLTAFVPIPMPAGANFEDVPMKIEGPGFNGGY